ncbi:MAG: hypothetical protein AB1422_09265 [bacterium]
MKLIETNRNLWKFVVFHNQFLPISIILSPYHSYLLIPFLTLLIYSLNGYEKNISVNTTRDTKRKLIPNISIPTNTVMVRSWNMSSTIGCIINHTIIRPGIAGQIRVVGCDSDGLSSEVVICAG